MSRKRISFTTSKETIEQLIPRFLIAKKAQGVSEKTLSTYERHFICIMKYFDLNIQIDKLTNDDINKLIITLRDSSLSPNSVSSYMRVFRAFIHWCNKEGYTSLDFQNIRDKETVKDVYTDEELKLLLSKPDNNCDFSEYRNWVIINLLMNCGCRASTIRNIKNEDVNFNYNQIILRHTKTGKIQSIPLCSTMVSILKSYMNIRKGCGDDYLFPNIYGEMMSESSLNTAIYRYNKRRGVNKTSIHLFRHTFARKFLIDCGGDAFILQQLLGHSTLDMTKHYCAIYDSDIAKNFDSLSPLSQISKTKEKIVRKR